MPAGFQSFTADNNVTQLTNDGIFFSLVTKGVLTGSESWGQEGQNSATHSMTISGATLADRPLLALHSTTRSTWATLTSSDSNSVTYTVAATNSGIIEWFLFSMKDPLPNPSKSGLELRRDNGTLCFASDFPPVLPLGIIDNDGYTGISVSGRKVAHIPIKESHYQFNNYTYAGVGSCLTGGQPGSLQYLHFGFARSSVTAGMGVIAAAWNGRNRSFGPTQTGACMFGPQQPQTNQSNQPIFKSLIIDVTNY